GRVRGCTRGSAGGGARLPRKHPPSSRRRLVRAVAQLDRANPGGKTMGWGEAWGERGPAASDPGRRALPTAPGPVLDGRTLRDDGDAMLRDIEPRLRIVVSDTLGIKPERIDRLAALDQDLGIDPLDVIDLVTRIEAAFGVSFPEGELDALRTF